MCEGSEVDNRVLVSHPYYEDVNRLQMMFCAVCNPSMFLRSAKGAVEFAATIDVEPWELTEIKAALEEVLVQDRRPCGSRARGT